MKTTSVQLNFHSHSLQASVVPIPNATSFINFGLNVLATGHVDCRADNPDFCYLATFKLFVFSKVRISKSA